VDKVFKCSGAETTMVAYLPDVDLVAHRLEGRYSQSLGTSRDGAPQVQTIPVHAPRGGAHCFGVCIHHQLQRPLALSAAFTRNVWLWLLVQWLLQWLLVVAVLVAELRLLLWLLISFTMAKVARLARAATFGGALVQLASGLAFVRSTRLLAQHGGLHGGSAFVWFLAQ
jgi:hypothetical protein